MNLLGIDLGSSSVKVALVEAATGVCIASAQSPAVEMGMEAAMSGWAEQDPWTWYNHFETALQQLRAAGHDLSSVKGIGISYQMHGLVVVDAHLNVLRPSIIWCDSRAVANGEALLAQVGQAYASASLLNSPGNFTAAKLAWVKVNEPELFAKIRYAMLPGDWLAMVLTGQPTTTLAGLSEGIFVDFATNDVSVPLLAALGVERELLPPVCDTFSMQGTILKEMADKLGLPHDASVTYRAGDQANNAFSLNVIDPGEVAANAGTSGVVYAVTDKVKADAKSRVNFFAHVNHTAHTPRLGILACLNGTGIAYSWLRSMLTTDEVISYPRLNAYARDAKPGAKGLKFYPFGNGAERFLENKPSAAGFSGFQFNAHGKPELVRATLEGIAFALKYGVEIMSEMDFVPAAFKAGNANMFQSKEFQQIFAAVMGAPLTIYNADGAIGAARAAGVGLGANNIKEAAQLGLSSLNEVAPTQNDVDAYAGHYSEWKSTMVVN